MSQALARADWRDWLLAASPAGRWQARLGGWYRGWLGFRRNGLALSGLIVVLILVAVALAAPLLADPHAATAQTLAERLRPPSWTHPFGTDELGRDILARIIFGARITLTIVVLVAVVVTPIGLGIGLCAGYLGGVADAVLMRLTDIFLSFPRLILALALASALRPGLVSAILAIALTSWPPYARLARAEAMACRRSEFVLAAELQGASRLRILWSQILPLCVSSVIIRLTLDMAGIIITAAGLGFLGLGAQPPTPEWGTMLAGALEYYQRAWWVLTFPGLAILVTVLAFNLFGDGLRDALDPKLKR